MGLTTAFLLCALCFCTGQASFLGRLRRASCVDQNESCQAWAVRGECVSNPSYMLTYCPVSCFQCTPTGGSGSGTGGSSGGSGSSTGGSTGGSGSSSSGCHDQNGSCASWAANGECVNNPTYMFTHCAQSCDSCDISIVG